MTFPKLQRDGTLQQVSQLILDSQDYGMSSAHMTSIFPVLHCAALGPYPHRITF